MRPQASLGRVLDDLGATLLELVCGGAAGLVLRMPVPTPPVVAAAVKESGVPVLGLTRGASWTQLAALLRSLLAEGDVGDEGPETLGGIPSGDLFAVANAVAALIDAPITIEDRSSRVMAFSGRQDEADRSRARIATDYLDRVGDRCHAVIGVGQVASDTAGLPAARASADRALRVLRAGHGGGRRVARLAPARSATGCAG